MASSAKDIQLRELKDTISQLNTMVSEQTELIKSLRLIIDEKSSHEKVLQEQIDYLKKNSLAHPAKEDPMIFRDSRISSMKQKWNRIYLYWKKIP